MTVNDELKIMWKEAVQDLPGGSENYYETLQMRWWLCRV